MAQFDVHGIDGGYVVDCQSDLLAGLSTRLVAPLLLLEDAPKPAERLNPVFEIAGKQYIMMAQYIAAVPSKMMGTPVISLANHNIVIVGAIDFLLAGC